MLNPERIPRSRNCLVVSFCTADPNQRTRRTHHCCITSNVTSKKCIFVPLCVVRVFSYSRIHGTPSCSRILNIFNAKSYAFAGARRCPPIHMNNLRHFARLCHSHFARIAALPIDGTQRRVRLCSGLAAAASNRHENRNQSLVRKVFKPQRCSLGNRFNRPI